MQHRSTFGLVVFVALLLGACGDSEPEGAPGGGRGAPGEVPIAAVEVVQAHYGALPLEERLSGRVRADNQVVIYPEVAAHVVRVAAQTGDYVQRGQPLVYLRDTQLREQLQQAQAALQVSQAEAQRTEVVLQEIETRLQRTEELAAKQYQSQQELQALQAEAAAAEANHQQARARIAQAEASVDEAREALRRTVVRAPISGYVGQRNAEIGMRVDTGTQLFTIGNLDVLRVNVAITDAMIGRIQEGQTALISSPNLGERVIEAKVSRISPFLEADSYSAAAEIDVPNEERLLRPGMFVAVDVLYGESQQATLVPLSALYENPNSGRLGVYVATSLGTEMPVEVPEEYDETDPPPLYEATPVQFRPVEVLARGREVAGIAGVQPGDWVVTVGQNLLSSRGEGRVQARVRPIPWERVVSLQRLQDDDLLREFMAKQQRLAQGGSAPSGKAAAPDDLGQNVSATD